MTIYLSYLKLMITIRSDGSSLANFTVKTPVLNKHVVNLERILYLIKKCFMHQLFRYDIFYKRRGLPNIKRAIELDK